MIAVGACCFMRRAVGLATRRARACVLAARLNSVDVTGDRTVLPAEDLIAHAARRRAGRAGNVTGPADAHALRARRPATRAGERPRATAIQPSFGDETALSLPLPSAGNLPLGALDEQFPFGQLHRMDNDSHSMPPLLLGAPPRVFSLVGAPSGHIGRLG